MEQGVWQEIEQLYQKFQKLGINEAVDYDKYYLFLLLPIPQPLKAQRLRSLIRSFFFVYFCSHRLLFNYSFYRCHTIFTNISF